MATVFDQMLEPVMRELRRLAKKVSAAPSVRGAMVTGVAPLRIQFDNEPAPVGSSPQTLVPVGEGDRVRVLHYGGTQYLILGVLGFRGRPWREAAGIAQFPMVNGTGEWVTVAFPPGRFTLPPIVVVSVTSGAGAANGTTPRFVVDSASSGRVHVRGNSQTVTIPVAWHAIQMTPTSAEG